MAQVSCRTETCFVFFFCCIYVHGNVFSHGNVSFIRTYAASNASDVINLSEESTGWASAWNLISVLVAMITVAITVCIKLSASLSEQVHYVIFVLVLVSDVFLLTVHHLPNYCFSYNIMYIVHHFVYNPKFMIKYLLYFIFNFPLLL